MRQQLQALYESEESAVALSGGCVRGVAKQLMPQHLEDLLDLTQDKNNAKNTQKKTQKIPVRMSSLNAPLPILWCTCAPTLLNDSQARTPYVPPRCNTWVAGKRTSHHSLLRHLGCWQAHLASLIAPPSGDSLASAPHVPHAATLALLASALHVTHCCNTRVAGKRTSCHS